MKSLTLSQAVDTLQELLPTLKYGSPFEIHEDINLMSDELGVAIECVLRWLGQATEAPPLSIPCGIDPEELEAFWHSVEKDD